MRQARRQEMQSLEADGLSIQVVIMQALLVKYITYKTSHSYISCLINAIDSVLFY